MQKKRFFSAALAVMMLFSACGINSTAPSDDVPTGEEPVIAYVPLDDRPNNYECMDYMAQSLGYKLLMPDVELFSTRLNGEGGSKCGDRAAVYEWVLEQEKQGCDRYIIFMDQLLSGGLVNSRAMTESEPVTLSDGTVLSEEKMLSDLMETLGADENNRVWLLDTVMRLAPTVGYEHWTLEDYTNVRAYCAAERLNLEGGALCSNNIIYTYRTAPDGSIILPEDYGTTEEKVAESLAARARKLTLSDMLFAAAGDNMRILFGIDDSSEQDCIQKNEINYLRSCLRDGDALLSGVDDMGFKALARLYLDELGWQGDTATVRYFGENEDKNASDFDYRPLKEIVAEHMNFFDLEPAADAELQILVLTQPADGSMSKKYCRDLLKTLNENFENGRPTMLMDAGNTGYGDYFRNMLIDKAELGKLIAYSGTLDLANLTGTALSHGVARYAFLKYDHETQQTARGFMKCLGDVLLKDMAYRTRARAEVADFVMGIGGNPDNFRDPAIDESEVREYMADRMNELDDDIIDNLRHSNFITGIEPYDELGWGSIEFAEIRFPWSRTFEITMDVLVGNPVEPHEKTAGIYFK